MRSEVDLSRVLASSARNRKGQPTKNNQTMAIYGTSACVVETTLVEVKVHCVVDTQWSYVQR